MRIVCPFIQVGDPINNRLNLQAQTRTFVESLGGEFFDCSGSDYKYFEYFRQWWHEGFERGESFCIIEQDVVPTLAGIESLKRCNHSWCGCPYNIGGGLSDRSLGCTKFSFELIRKQSGLPEHVANLRRPGAIFPSHSWTYLDSSIAEYLMQHLQPSIPHHVHSRHPANHLKVYQ